MKLFDIFRENAGRVRKTTEAIQTPSFKRISHFLLRRPACLNSFISPDNTRVDKFLRKPEKL